MVAGAIPWGCRIRFQPYQRIGKRPEVSSAGFTRKQPEHRALVWKTAQVIASIGISGLGSSDSRMEVRMGGKKLRLASGLALVVGVAAIAASPAAAKGGSHGHKNKSATPVVKVLATGLHNPRHVSIGSRHEILVAEAGQGGGLDCTTKVFVGPEGGPNCIGMTGSIARIGRHGKLTRIVTGLPSMGDAQTIGRRRQRSGDAGRGRAGRRSLSRPLVGAPHRRPQDRRHHRRARPVRPRRDRRGQRHHRARHAPAVRRQEVAQARPQERQGEGQGARRPVCLRGRERSGRRRLGRLARCGLGS